VHCLSEKKKQPDESSRTTYQPYSKHLQNSVEANGGDGPASVEMTSLLDDRGLSHSHFSCCCIVVIQGDHCGKPASLGEVRELEMGQGKVRVRDLTKSL